jgi:hypothetical protein
MKKPMIIAGLLALAACSNDNVSVDTLEEQKAMARDNATFNASLFRSEDPRYANYKIVPNGDSTQVPNCPQGDGWATITLLGPNNEAVKIKCSTYSKSTGCLLDSEFAKKSYAADDGKCQPTTKVPYPLKKIAS